MGDEEALQPSPKWPSLDASVRFIIGESSRCSAFLPTKMSIQKSKVSYNLQYVCMWTIWTNVKPLFFCFGLICRGRQGRCMAVANEAPCSWLGYHSWSPWRTCYQFWSLSDMWRGSTQEPPRSFWFIISCTVFAIWLYLKSKLQQPSVRMSSENLNSHPFLSGELDCFCT